MDEKNSGTSSLLKTGCVIYTQLVLVGCVEGWEVVDQTLRTETEARHKLAVLHYHFIQILFQPRLPAPLRARMEAWLQISA